MEPVIGIQTLLLRTQLPEVTLRPGTSVVARVLSRGEHHGVLVIAGIPLSAQLPRDVGATGETLRLTVSDVTADRVTLQLDQVLNPEAQPPPAPADRPRVTVQDPPRTVRVGGEERSSVALSCSSPALGRLDLRLELAGTRLTAAVEAPAGRAFALADAAAGRLQDGLHARTGLDAAVQVMPRREPLDLYA
jgi:hypothetical protein